MNSRVVKLVLIIAFLTPALHAQDVITIGNGPTCLSVPWGSWEVIVPIYVQDMSGTTLGTDKTLKIRQVSAAIRPNPKAALRLNTSSDLDAGLQSSGIGTGVAFDWWYGSRPDRVHVPFRYTADLPFRSNPAAPGDRVADYILRLNPQLAVGTNITLELLKDDPSTYLASDAGGDIETVRRGSLQLVNGCLRIDCSNPAISQNLMNVSVTSGSTARLEVIAAGPPPLSYQWYLGSPGVTTSPISGATSAVYTTGTISTQTSYWVRITSSCTLYTNSAGATVTPCTSAPTITSNPVGVTIPLATATTLSVSATGAGPFSYQWYTGSSGDTSAPITGATGATYTPTVTQNTNYWVKVSNACGFVNSTTATVTVCNAAPTISAQPTSRSVQSGTATTVNVTATGTGPFTYQWYEGTAPSTTTPVGTNASAFTVTLTTTKSYWVKVSNACGSTNSTTATATVCTVAPGISTQPTSRSVQSGTATTFSVTASGASPYTYQWYEGTAPSMTTPVGTNASSFMVTLTTTKSYWVKVSNACGSINSTTATGTVCTVAPTIATQPMDKTITCTSGSAILSVTGGGSGPFSYQWYRGNAGDTTTPVSGGTGSSYDASGTQTTTNYWVRVSNACGSVNSRTTTVTVRILPAITQQPASQTSSAESTASMTVLANGTGTLYYQWYIGTSGDTSTPVSGANSLTYTTPLLYSTRNYWVRVTDDCGSTNSTTATITVLP